MVRRLINVLGEPEQPHLQQPTGQAVLVGHAGNMLHCQIVTASAVERLNLTTPHNIGNKPEFTQLQNLVAEPATGGS